MKNYLISKDYQLKFFCNHKIGMISNYLFDVYHQLITNFNLNTEYNFLKI